MIYNVQHKTSRHHGDATLSTDRQTEWHFAKRMYPTEKKEGRRRGGGQREHNSYSVWDWDALL
jgi:hypothetical protein